MTTGRINQVFVLQHSTKSVHIHFMQQHIVALHQCRLQDGTKLLSQAFYMLTSIHIHTFRLRVLCWVNLQLTLSTFEFSIPAITCIKLKRKHTICIVIIGLHLSEGIRSGPKTISGSTLIKVTCGPRMNERSVRIGRAHFQLSLIAIPAFLIEGLHTQRFIHNWHNVICCERKISGALDLNWHKPVCTVQIHIHPNTIAGSIRIKSSCGPRIAQPRFIPTRRQLQGQYK